ncbi:hypothetical protein [Specibacter sp. NPDC078692]|uniref:hypothetical protein n=1 Tax=Specibacter sp. NPDC078692 TaxID=3155818 RepID=UPI0034338BC7
MTKTTAMAAIIISAKVTANGERPRRGVETTSDNDARDFLTLGAGGGAGKGPVSTRAVLPSVTGMVRDALGLMRHS